MPKWEKALIGAGAVMALGVVGYLAIKAVR